MKKSYRAFALAVAVLIAVCTATTCPAQTFSVLHSFASQAGDVERPQFGPIAQGRDGNLYSAAPYGGAHGVGGVFKITPAGEVTTLYSFCSQANCADGAYPYGGLTLGTDGNFYGTTLGGGNQLQACVSNGGCGTIFRITPEGGLSVLYSFTDGSDGSGPEAAPIEGRDGNFYGTASSGGAAGCGTVYKLTTSAIFTPLYAFDETHGCAPSAPLLLATNGDFYSTAFIGGPYYNGVDPGFGVVFKITPAGKLTVLYNFDATHGAYSYSPLVQGNDGYFYGTTSSGGTGDADGVIFKMTAKGTLTVIYELNPSTDGFWPNAGLVQATDGYFYGAASALSNSNCGGISCGTLFRINPKGTYLDIFTLLYTFDTASAAEPQATPFQHTNGIVYGESTFGGVVNPDCYYGCGTFYSWDANLPASVSLLPYSGKVGSTIEFLGQGFTSETTVSFDGVPAQVTVSSATYLTAEVPSGAKTGFVTVSTAGETLTSNKKFRVLP